MKEKLTVIKVGGKIVEEPDTLNQLLNNFSSMPGYKGWYTVEAVRLPVLPPNWVLRAGW